MNDGHRPQPTEPHVHVCASLAYPEHHSSMSCICTCGTRFDATASAVTPQPA